MGQPTIVLHVSDFWRAKDASGELVAMFNQTFNCDEAGVIVKINDAHPGFDVVAYHVDGRLFSDEEVLEANDLLNDYDIGEPDDDQE